MKNRGFTLIELLVAISIIILLSTLILVNYRSGRRQYDLSQATQRLASELRRAQNMAISGINRELYCGFGVQINPDLRPDSYYFYSDISISGDCQDSNYQWDSGDDTEIIKLPQNIVFVSSTPITLDVFFRPPYPTTYINGDDAAPPGLLKMQVEGSDTLVKFLRVNTSGLVQIE